MVVNRYVGFKEEASFGTEASVPMAFDMTDGISTMALDAPDDPNIAVPTLNRFQKRHVPGFYSPDGSMEHTIDINTIGWFLKWLLGGYKFTAGSEGGLNTHEFYSTQSMVLPSFTTRTGKDTFEHVMLGCVLNNMELTIDKDLATAKTDIIAQKDKKAALRTTLNELDDTIYPIAFYNVNTTIGGTSVSQDVLSWKWTYKNGIKAEDGLGQGSRFPYSLNAKDGSTELAIKINDDGSEKLEAFWGNATGPSNDPQALFAVQSIFDSGTFGNMHINFPRSYYTKAPTDIKEAEPRTPELGIGIEADEITLADSTTKVVSPVLITLQNKQPEYKLTA
jgi:hypothetical protein